MSFLARLITWINVPVNALGGVLLAPVAAMPGWLSMTIISAVAGVILLLIFKYTSNQNAIGRTRDGIKANMLALRLFQDSIAVTLRSQGLVFRGALVLIFHSALPLLVMIVPVTLLLGQMGLWYQHRPLEPGERAIVTMCLEGAAVSGMPEASIESMPTARLVTGPVRIASDRRIYWEIEAVECGERPIVFEVGGEKVSKELVVGGGFSRISSERPGRRWGDILKNPKEKPFRHDSKVESVGVAYPGRQSRISGTNWWVLYFFVASMVFALIARPFLKVRI